jgi:hypothetical protein
LAGGYGLYVKQLNVAEAGHPTLIPIELWRAPRATQDRFLGVGDDLS